MVQCGEKFMLLFSDQTSGRGKSFQGGTASGGTFPVAESQCRIFGMMLFFCIV